MPSVFVLGITILISSKENIGKMSSRVRGFETYILRGMQQKYFFSGGSLYGIDLKGKFLQSERFHKEHRVFLYRVSTYRDLIVEEK